jgi:hypothetical protein
MTRAALHPVRGCRADAHLFGDLPHVVSLLVQSAHLRAVNDHLRSAKMLCTSLALKTGYCSTRALRQPHALLLGESSLVATANDDRTGREY